MLHHSFCGNGKEKKFLLSTIAFHPKAMMLRLCWQVSWLVPCSLFRAGFTAFPSGICRTVAKGGKTFKELTVAGTAPESSICFGITGFPFKKAYRKYAFHQTRLQM